MNNCNMSVGFYFFPEIREVVIDLRFFLNHCSNVCNFTNIEWKTKSYPYSKIIDVKYIWEFFGNFHMTRSRGIMLEV